MKNKIVGAEHEFHDRDFVTGWAERFRPTPERVKLFKLILSELRSRIPENARVVELGTGPGYLAEYLLNAMPGIEYIGIDFSEPMFDIARERLASSAARISYIKADLVEDDWQAELSKPVDAIVSTWTLHDLGSQGNVEIVYKKCAGSLCKGGVLLNGDFIKPDEASHEFEAGRFQIHRHLEMLNKLGFRDVKCLAQLEKEIDSPTASQNYACFRGTT